MQDAIKSSNYNLTKLTNINIMLGKNGCGKSTILRDISNSIIDNTLIKYITPQRGGTLSYNSSIENNMINNPGWSDQSRKANYDGSFKEQSITQYKNLEINVLRRFQNNTLQQKTAIPFEHYLNLINQLLDEIVIKSEGNTIFSITKKNSEIPLTTNQISSGESELICLGIECLSFIHDLSDKNGVLLLDEPDVHLHPDLQDRLVKFLLQLLKENEGLQILMATHSTAIVGALSCASTSSIAFIEANSYYETHGGTPKEINFNKINDQYKKILPIFGAHPLTSVYCENPILLVEGEDDVRIWQQVVRSSINKIKLTPVECGSKDEIKKFEDITNNILNAVYNKDARGYSLRDGDGISEPLQDEGSIIRIRLNCYAAENCILSNDVLKSLRISWEDMKLKIDEWLEQHKDESNRNDYKELLAFKEKGFDKKNHKIKHSRNVLISLSDNDKPWEVIVGKAIANIVLNSDECNKDNDSLYDYLGENLFKILVELNQ